MHLDQRIIGFALEHFQENRRLAGCVSFEVWVEFALVAQDKGKLSHGSGFVVGGPAKIDYHTGSRHEIPERSLESSIENIGAENQDVNVQR